MQQRNMKSGERVRAYKCSCAIVCSRVPAIAMSVHCPRWPDAKHSAIYIYIYIVRLYIWTYFSCMHVARSMQRVNIMVLKFGWMPKDLNTSIQALARPQYSIAASSRALSIIIIIKIFIIFVAYLLLLPFDAINFSHCTDCGQSTACTVHTHTSTYIWAIDSLAALACECDYVNVSSGFSG